MKQIKNFNKDDWKHIWWLFGNMIKQFILGNWNESKDAYYWIKIHCTYESKKVK
jgi:hypothetical protein